MDVLMPLPQTDFDPTESAVPWKVLTDAGHSVIFATPRGEPGHADERMVTGKGLGPLAPILKARSDARQLYEEMTEQEAYRNPVSYGDLAELAFDGLVLPGGHAPGMKEYLEADAVQTVAAACFAEDKPVGAICHGVIVLARTTNGETGRCVLHGRKTTALLRSMELLAWGITRLWLGSYYRTYPETVQDEVVSQLASEDDFVTGPPALLRDAPDKLERGFTVRDGNYVSARWPGDAYRFSNEFLDILE